MLLVTGFRPFAGESVNPSEMLLTELQRGLQVQTLLLPVEYEGAFQALKTQIEIQRPRAVLMLGQAGPEPFVRLERLAINLRDADLADEAGIKYLESPIDTQGPLALATALPLRDWYTKMAPDYPVSLSNSAGAFVCNSLYYQFLSWSRTLEPNLPGLFVHVPMLPEQVKRRQEMGTFLPGLDLNQTLAVVEEIIRILQETLPT